MARIWLIAAMLLALVGIAAPASAQNAGTVKCESQNYRPNTCPVYDITDARIVERLGGTCTQGRDWSYDRRGIFVTNGCRAVFQFRTSSYGNSGGGYNPGGGYPGGGYPGGSGGAPGQTVTCESRDGRTSRCPMDTRGGVRLVRNLSSTQCRQGISWGFDRGGVWVSGGCRGEFAAIGGGGGYPGGGYPGGGYPGGGGGYPGGNAGAIIECSSRDYQPNRCSANINRGVEIVAVLGGECIQGRSWGWNRSSIWVNNGCRGRFRVF